MADKDPIPERVAFELCQRIRGEKKVRMFSQCWGCVKFSKGDFRKMCYYDPPMNRGCGLVNKLYDPGKQE
ncbi:MAG: hypothetical protein JSW28_07920 [Thermoplasmata archaeon]|nr:MAG: hypothetical protein JSW28_07920 [Thermoplasmata archaeon]